MLLQSREKMSKTRATLIMVIGVAVMCGEVLGTLMFIPWVEEVGMAGKHYSFMVTLCFLGYIVALTLTGWITVFLFKREMEKDHE